MYPYCVKFTKLLLLYSLRPYLQTLRRLKDVAGIGSSQSNGKSCPSVLFGTTQISVVGFQCFIRTSRFIIDIGRANFRPFQSNKPAAVACLFVHCTVPCFVFHRLEEYFRLIFVLRKFVSSLSFEPLCSVRSVCQRLVQIVP